MQSDNREGHVDFMGVGEGGRAHHKCVTVSRKNEGFHADGMLFKTRELELSLSSSCCALLGP